MPASWALGSPTPCKPTNIRENMKNYIITNHKDARKNEVFLTSKDKNPIIPHIVFRIIKEGNNPARWNIDIEINNETTEMRSLFYTVPGVDKEFRMGLEGMPFLPNQEYMIKFFEVIQTIDPIPYTAMQEIMKLIDFDLNKFLEPALIQHNLELAESLIQQKLESGDHQGVLQLALEQAKENNHEALQKVANFYQERNDLDNYVNVLLHYPSTHPLFVKAGKLAHKCLLDLPISIDKDQKNILLEKKLKAVLICGDTELASHYFNELCGASGMNNTVNVKIDADTLVSIARNQRNLNEELKELRAYKVKTEEAKIKNGEMSLKFF